MAGPDGPPSAEVPRQLFHRFRRSLASLALLAMLANALMPTLAQAQARLADGSGVAGWTEICAADGTRWVRLDAAGAVLERSATRPEGAPAALHGACGYCLPHAGSFALPAPDPGHGPAPAALATGLWAAPAAAPEVTASFHWDWPALRGPPRT